MNRRISFVTRPDGERIAYAVMGDGPLLVRPPGWLNHLHVAWESPWGPYGRDVTEHLAKRRRVIWYDRHGAGLSDRNRTDFTWRDDLIDLETVVRELALGDFALFAISDGGPTALAYAKHHPESVSRIAFYGSAASRNPARFHGFAIRRIIAELIRTDWVLASRALCDLFSPSFVSEESLAFVARLLRESATPEMAAALFEEAEDVTDLIQDVAMPALVLHRRDDQVVPFEAGREMAQLLPNCRFVALEGNVHTQIDDEVLAEIDAFLDEAAPSLGPSTGLSQREVEVLRSSGSPGRESPARALSGASEHGLSARQKQVLQFIAEGRSNKEIAEQLVLSLRTVERHVADLYTKLDIRNRAEATAYAMNLPNRR